MLLLIENEKSVIFYFLAVAPLILSIGLHFLFKRNLKVTKNEKHSSNNESKKKYTHTLVGKGVITIKEKVAN